MLHRQGKKGERKEREGRNGKEGKGREGKETGRKVKWIEKKGTTAICSDTVQNWLEMLPCPRIWNSWCYFLEKCMILVDRVATKSMDSRGEWGCTSVRQRSGQKLYASWLEMLPCPRIWNIWCYFSEN